MIKGKPFKSGRKSAPKVLMAEYPVFIMAVSLYLLFGLILGSLIYLILLSYIVCTIQMKSREPYSTRHDFCCCPSMNFPRVVVRL